MADHYYDQFGHPCYTVIGANGKERNTNVADARKLGLVPSVTTILNMAAKPGLINWMLDQAILAALTLPKKEDEDEASYLKRVKHDSKQQGKDAADFGTRIHNAIEIYMGGENVSDEYVDYCEAVAEVLYDFYGDVQWIAEESFAHSLKFGGKVDLHSDGIVIDVKTKEFGPDDKVDGYEEHCIQLAAYREGLQMPKAECANVFVSRTHPGLVRVIQWDQKELAKGWQMFQHYLAIWKLKNNFN